MANHKRKRPKHLRAGCLLCKSWKDEREPKAARIPPNAQRQLQGGVPDGDWEEDISMEQAREEVNAGIPDEGLSGEALFWRTQWAAVFGPNSTHR